MDIVKASTVIMDVRMKPTISMLEDIRIYVMQRMVKMQLNGHRWDRLNVCANIRDKLNLLKMKQKYVTNFTIE